LQRALSAARSPPISAAQRYGKRPSDGRKARRTWSAAAQKQQPPPPLKPSPRIQNTPRVPAPYPQDRSRPGRHDRSVALSDWKPNINIKIIIAITSQSKTPQITLSFAPSVAAKQSQNWHGAIKPLPLHKTQIRPPAACNSVSRVRDREIDEVVICACSATSRRRPCPVPDQTG
jgi:hypothetical protein